MEEKMNFYQLVRELYAEDSRYHPDSYEFIMQALTFTQKKLKKQTHVNGRELSEGLRDFAIDQYGPMAKTVIKHWGVSRTEDFGNIVFNMIEKKLLSKSEEDSLLDFDAVYDFKAAFSNVLADSVIERFKLKK